VRLNRRALLWNMLLAPMAGCVSGSVTVRSPLLAAGATMTEQELRATLQALVMRSGRELSSLAVAVLAPERPPELHAFGRAWIDPADRGRDRPATSDTLYRIASVSKLIVALAAAELCVQGVLAPEADLNEVLGFKLRSPYAPDVAITLGQLLSHTSSLRDAAGYNFAESVALADVLRDPRAWGREAPPGAYFHYCNLGFGVAAQAMERATGERFDRLLQRLLFRPLGITATFDPASLSDPVRQLATLYRKRPAGDGMPRWDPAGPWVAQVDDYHAVQPQPRATDAYTPGRNGSLFAPHGGLRISVAGLARLANLMLRGGRDGSGRAGISPQALELLFRERWRYDPAARNGRGNRAEDDEGAGGLFNAWGFGPQRFLDVSSGPGRGDRLVEGGGLIGWGHLGNAYGLTSALVLAPDRTAGFVFLSGGTAFDPETERGAYSAHYRYEEQLATLLWRRALTA